MSNAKILAAEAKQRALAMRSTGGHGYDEMLAAIDALAALAEGPEKTPEPQAVATPGDPVVAWVWDAVNKRREP